MFPTIDTGSIIVVKKMNSYDINDIISFYSKIDNQEKVVTHRIVRIGGNVYLTKGDANQALDEKIIVPRLIIGKVIMIFPYIGYIASFVKSKIGVWFMIIIPSIFIVFGEIIRIVFLIKKKD